MARLIRTPTLVNISSVCRQQCMDCWLPQAMLCGGHGSVQGAGGEDDACIIGTSCWTSIVQPEATTSSVLAPVQRRRELEQEVVALSLGLCCDDRDDGVLRVLAVAYTVGGGVICVFCCVLTQRLRPWGWGRGGSKVLGLSMVCAIL